MVSSLSQQCLAIFKENKNRLFYSYLQNQLVKWLKDWDEIIEITNLNLVILVIILIHMITQLIKVRKNLSVI